MHKFSLLIFYLIVYFNLEAKPKLIKENVYLEINNDYSVKVSIEMYFINAKGYKNNLAFPENETIKYKKFQAFWNNEKLNIEKENSPDGNYFQIGNEYYTSLYKFKVQSKSANKAIHKVQYIYNPFYYKNQKYDDNDGYLIQYILKTGSFWNQRVKHLQIKVKFKDPICFRVRRLESTYEGKCKSKNIWKFKADNIELTRNLELIISN